MRTNKKRALNVALIATGLAIAALGTVLFLTNPSAAAFTGHMGRGNYQDQRQSQNYESMRFGNYRMLNMTHFGGMAFFILGFMLIGGIAFKRSHGHGSIGRDHVPSREEDAISLLRREFAEGRINEDDYRKRLDALLK